MVWVCFEFRFSVDLVWFLCGLGLVLVWFEFGFSLVRVWVYFGLSSVLVWCLGLVVFLCVCTLALCQV